MTTALFQATLVEPLGNPVVTPRRSDAQWPPFSRN